MDWAPWLEEGERVRWEGRPAPRCYTFRKWRRSVYALLFLLLAVYWQIVGFEASVVYGVVIYRWLPAPFVLVSLYLAVGYPALARLRWEKIFYAVTDRRVLISGGRRGEPLSCRWADIDSWDYLPIGQNLGSIRMVIRHARKPVFLHCLEHPGRVREMLGEALEN
jgi:integrase